MAIDIMSISGSASELALWMRSMTASLRGINEERDLSFMLDLIAEHACSLLGLRQAAVYVLDPATETFEIGGSYGLTDAYVATANATPIRLSEAGASFGPPTARAVLTRRPVVVGDAFVEPGLERWRASMALEGLRTIVSAPLRGADGAALGTITGYAESANAISEPELAQIALLSDHAAAAIVAARRRDSERAAIRALQDANAALIAQQIAVSNLRDLQHHLIELVLQDAALPRIVDFLGDRLDAEVYVDTVSGQPVALGSGGDDDVPPAFARLHELPKGHVRATIKSGRATLMSTTDKRAMFLVPVPQTSRVEPLRMWVRHRSAGFFDEDAVRAMEGCALLIALQQSRQEVQAHAEARIVRELLSDLLSPAAMLHADAVMARATALGHDTAVSHIPIVGLPVSGRDQDGGELTRNRLTSALSAAMRGVRPKPVIGTVGTAVVVLLPAAAESSASQFFEDFVRRASPANYRWLAGTVAPSLREAQEHLNIALRAADLLNPDSPRVAYLEGLGVPALLLEAATAERLLGLAMATLGPVLDADRGKGGSLLATLVEWFRNDMSTRETAERMFLHANTVSYRLRRIGELTGLKLTDPGDLMTVRLALDILQIRGVVGGDMTVASSEQSA